VSISDVQHQPRAHRIIQRALASHRMPHAYLFAGPEGVGKELMALGVAQMLLCSSPVRRAMPGLEGVDGLDACGACQDCVLVKAGTHPDLQLVHRQLNRQHPDSTIRKQKALFVSVDVIRHFLVDRAGSFPSRGRARVFIVREAERMNDQAQNALLKTLEEPPEATFIILLTSALDRMLPTTRSRCQPVLFQSLPTEFVAGRLGVLRPDASAPEREYLARHAAGSLGAAIRQVDDGLFPLKQAWGERLGQIVAGGRGFAPHALAKPFQEDAQVLGKKLAERDPDVSDTDATRAGLQTLLGVLADFYLDALRRVSEAGLSLINGDQPAVIDRLAEARDRDTLTAGLRALADAEANLSRNANIDLTLEAMFIALASGRRLTPAA
jgi:DNA polymerase III subunit delta'